MLHISKSLTMYTLAVVLLTFLITQVSCDRVWVVTRKLPAGLITRSSSVNKLGGIIVTSDLAVDGRDESDFQLGSCFSSGEGDMAPVWFVDMGRTYHVYSVDILNRGDCCGEQLSNVIIDVTEKDPLSSSGGTHSHCGMITDGAPAGSHINTVCLYHLVKTDRWYKAVFPKGRYVKLQKGGDWLTLCEVEVRVVSETRNRNPSSSRSVESDTRVIEVPKSVKTI